MYPEAEVPGYTCPLPSEAHTPVRAPSSLSVRALAPAFGLLEPGRGKKRDGGREVMDDETSNKRQKKSVNQASVVTEPLGKLEQQTKDLLELEDELRERVTVEELKDMLCANDQDATGSEDELLERCAGGMMFGALSRWQECWSYMNFRYGSYWCGGRKSSETLCYVKCTNFTRTPGRQDTEPWCLGKACSNYYLMQAKLKQSVKAAGATLRDGTESIQTDKFLHWRGLTGV